MDKTDILILIFIGWLLGIVSFVPLMYFASLIKYLCS